MKRQSIKNFSLIIAWSLYDLANQFFALNIVTLYFARWLTLEKKAPEILYSVSFGISTLFIAILGPILGFISDLTGRRRPHLIYLTLIAIIFTMAMGFKDNILLNLVFFAIANFGCQTAIIFYNALMVNVAPADKIGLVSGVGRAFGYSGAILALYLVKPIVLKSGYQATFIPTGILFLIFALPCLLFVKDKGIKQEFNLMHLLKKDKIKEIFAQLRKSAQELYKFSGMSDFLKASFFGLAAVNAIILFMSVYATKVFALNEIQIIHLVAFSTFFAILGSFFSGFLSDYLGYKNTLIAVFILWGIAFFSGSFAQNIQWYWLIGGLVGLTLGATWAVSRALAIDLVPPEKTGAVFGLFNLVGQLSGIMGALFWGVMVLFLSRLGVAGYRITLFSLILFMVLGLVFLLRLPNIRRKAHG